MRKKTREEGGGEEEIGRNEKVPWSVKPAQETIMELSFLKNKDTISCLSASSLCCLCFVTPSILHLFEYWKPPDYSPPITHQRSNLNCYLFGAHQLSPLLEIQSHLSLTEKVLKEMREGFSSKQIHPDSLGILGLIWYGPGSSNGTHLWEPMNTNMRGNALPYMVSAVMMKRFFRQLVYKVNCNHVKAL